MKKIICFIFLSIIVILSSSCTRISYPENSSYSPIIITTAPITTNISHITTSNLDAPNTNSTEIFTTELTHSVRFFGRTFLNNKTEQTFFNYTCSGFEFTSTATKIEAYFSSSDYDNENKEAWLGVYVNDGDEMYKRFSLDKKEGWYTLYESETLQNLKIKVVRLSDFGSAKSAVSSLRIEGLNDITPTNSKERKIEFVGDSITSGYGIEAENQHDGFKSYQQNGMITFAALTAKHFDAEFSCVSCSGMGVYSSFTSNGTRNYYSLLSDLYKYTDMNLSTSANSIWDGSHFSPDVIVLNAGTNDSTYVKYDPTAREPQFSNAYYNLVKQIFSVNPNAKVICCVGPMDYSLENATQSIVNVLKKEGYNVHFLCFGKITSEEGLGGDYHPSALTHKRMAEELITEIDRLNIY